MVKDVLNQAEYTRDDLAKVLAEIFQRDNENFSPELVAQELILRRGEWEHDAVEILAIYPCLSAIKLASWGGVTNESMAHAAGLMTKAIDGVMR